MKYNFYKFERDTGIWADDINTERLGLNLDSRIECLKCCLHIFLVRVNFHNLEVALALFRIQCFPWSKIVFQSLSKFRIKWVNCVNGAAQDGSPSLLVFFCLVQYEVTTENFGHGVEVLPSGQPPQSA